MLSQILYDKTQDYGKLSGLFLQDDYGIIQGVGVSLKQQSDKDYETQLVTFNCQIVTKIVIH